MSARRVRQTGGRAGSTNRATVNTPPDRVLPSSTRRFGPRQHKEHTGVPADHFVKPEQTMSMRRALKLLRAERARRERS